MRKDASAPLSEIHPSWASQWLRRIQLLLSLLSVGVLVYVFIVVGRDMQSLLARPKAVSWGTLLVSEALLLFFFALQAQGWRLTLARLDGSKLSLGTAFHVWWLTQSGRYLPGKGLIWVGRYALASAHGVPLQTISLSLFLEHILTPLGAVLIFSLFSLMYVANFLGSWLWFIIGTAGGCLLLLSPPLLQKATDIWAQFRHQPQVQLRLNWTDIIPLAVHYMFQWAVAGTAFVVFLVAVTQIELENRLVLIGIFPLAWVCGFLSIITPGGLGVREAALGLLLTNFMPVSLAVFVASASRLWWMLGEGISFLTALSLARFHRSSAQIHVS